MNISVSMKSLLLVSAAALAALALQAAAPAFAQSAAALSGEVSSAKEGLMGGVVVSARKDDSTITVSVVSDDKGHFSFPASRLDSGVVARGGAPLDSSKARMAISANADSEIPLLAANCTKRSFSASAGRAVMDGLRGVGMLLLTRNVPLVQQNADTSLSCHQNNTDSKET